MPTFHDLLSSLKKEHVTEHEEHVLLYDLGLFGNQKFELVQLYAHTSYEQHIHLKSSSILYFVSGSGELLLDKEKFSYKRGDRYVVEKGMRHGFNTKEETLLLSINEPPIIDPLTGEVDFVY